MNKKKENSKSVSKDNNPYESETWTENLRFAYLEPFFEKATASAKSQKPLQCNSFTSIKTEHCFSDRFL